MAFLAAIPPLLETIGLATAADASASWLATSGLLAEGGTTAIAASGAPALGPLLGSFATPLSILGTGLSILGTIGQGQTQAEIYKRQAELALRQGEAERVQEKEKALQVSRARRKLIGEQEALYGGAGVDLTGTPLNVIADSYSNYERDIQNIGYSADVAARTGKGTSDLYRWAADRVLTGSYMKAGSTLLGGLGQSLLGPKEF